MDNTEQLISLYHTGFIASAVLMVMGLVLAVLFFFLFDIRNIFLIRSGRAKQKTIEDMQARNLKTGKLSAATPYTDSGELKKREEKRKSGAFQITGGKKDKGELPKSALSERGLRSHGQTGSTELLSEEVNRNNASDNKQQTADIRDPLKTEVMKSDNTDVRPAEENAGFRFTVTERTIVIHTAEII